MTHTRTPWMLGWPARRLLAWSLALLLAAPIPTGAAPTVTLDLEPTVVAHGGSLTVAWSAPGFGPKDWIGLFRADTTTNARYVWWRYVKEQSGRVTIPANFPPATYELRYLPNNRYESIAKSSTTIRVLMPGETSPGQAPPAPTPEPQPSTPPQPSPDPETLPAPTLMLSADPTRLSAGQLTTLSWSTTDADACAAEGGWEGSRAVSGNEGMAPPQTADFSLRCTGPGGSVAKSVRVIVDAPPAVPAPTPQPLPPQAPPTLPGGKAHYVSPTGGASGDGTQARPWDLKTALGHPPAVKPGDTIWLRAGTYGSGGPLSYTCTLKGTKDKPITVRQYPGERATVNAVIVAKGDYTWFWGFELTNTNLTRAVGDGDNGERPRGLMLSGRGNRSINMQVHDVGRTGVGFYGPETQVYGTLFWGNGIYDGGPRGSAIYANITKSSAADDHEIHDIITFRNFNYGIKVYTEWGDDYINGFDLQGNISFDHPKWEIIAHDTQHPVRALRIEQNYTYEPRTDDRFPSILVRDTPGSGSDDAVIKDNYFVGSKDGIARMGGWRNLTLTGNTWIGAGTFLEWEPASGGSRTWNGNTYFGGSAKPFDFNGGKDLAGWRSATGFDAASTHTQAYPKGVKIVVRPNRYEAGRAHIAVYNWDLKPTVSVDLAQAGLRPGQRYEIRDAQNFFGPPLVTGTHNGQPVMLSMQLTRVAPLVGKVTDIPNKHTAPEFAVFVVLPIGAMSTPPPPTTPPTDPPADPPTEDPSEDPPTGEDPKPDPEDPTEPPPTIPPPPIPPTTPPPTPPTLPRGKAHYVSPSGSASGDGTQARPWDLTTAFKHPAAVKPGDTIWLRAGKYGKGGSDLFTSTLTGTAAAPIIVRQYPGERATVDGAIMARGAHTWFWGFEITNSNSNRRVGDSGRRRGIEFKGVGMKVINMQIHEVGRTGISFHTDNGEVYGTLCWGNGIVDGGRLRGSCIYANVGKSTPTPGTNRIQEVISFRHYNYGLKVYSEWGDRFVDGFHIEGNVAFDTQKYNLIAEDTTKAIKGLVINQNYLYHRPTVSAYSTKIGSDKGGHAGRITGNYVVAGKSGHGGLWINSFTNLELRGNTVVAPAALIDWTPGKGATSLQGSGNTYLWGSSKPFIVNDTSRTFAEWRSATGFDTTGSHAPQPPKASQVFVRPNKYEPGRGHVIVYNWSKAATVSANLAATGLRQGQRYEIRDAQNFYGPPVASGTYDGRPVSLPMTLTAVDDIIGTGLPVPNRHTAPDFGVFVVLPLSGASSAPTAQPDAGLPMAAGPEYYVSPTGSASGDGTQARPWDLASALSGQQPIKPGDTLWIRGGTYKKLPRAVGDNGFPVKLTGTAQQPIHIRAAIGERATIDGGVTIDTPSAHLWFRDLEILVSEPRPGDGMPVVPPDPSYKNTNRPWGGVNVYNTEGCKFINLVVHRNNQGISWWVGAKNSEVHGCLIYDNGWQATDRGHGHGLYTQNENGLKTVSDNIFTKGFAFPVHGYSQGGYVNNYLFEGNILYDTPYRFLAGTTQNPSKGLRAIGNYLYGADLQFGYADDVQNEDCELRDNVLVNGEIILKQWTKVINQNNLTLLAGQPRPSGAKIILRPNKYDGNRANLVVYNWDKKPLVAVDPSSFLKRGDTYRLMKPTEFFGTPALTGTYAGQPIQVPVSGEFAAFVLLRNGPDAPPPTQPPQPPPEPPTSPPSNPPVPPPSNPPSPPDPDAVAITIDGGIVHQTMDGFGASSRVFDDPHVTDTNNPSTGRAGVILPVAAQDEILKRLYTDLKLTRVRPVMEGKGVESINDNADPNQTDMTKFDFAWKRTDAHIDHVQRARKLGVNMWFVSPLEFEPWIRQADVDETAEWALVQIRRWRARGAPLPYYSIRNEPGNPCCGDWSGEFIRDVIKRLGPKLRAEGIATRFVITDDLTPVEAAKRCRTILADPKAREYVGALAFHLYGNSDATEMVTLSNQYKLPLWMSEYSESQPMTWAGIMHDMISRYRVSAVDYMWGFFGQWQAGTELVTIRHQDNQYTGYEPTKHYYVVGHFSKFIRPGAKRIEARAGAELRVTAYRDNDQLTIVIVNTGSTTRARVSLAGLPAVSQLAVVRTSQSENWKALPNLVVSGSAATVDIVANSITTLTGQFGGASPPGNPPPSQPPAPPTQPPTTPPTQPPSPPPPSGGNTAPKVNAGPDKTVELPPGVAKLEAWVTDDGKPAPADLVLTWSKISGPGTVVFSNPEAGNPDVMFSKAGVYVVELEASDGALTGRDRVTVTVTGEGSPPSTPAPPSEPPTHPENPHHPPAPPVDPHHPTDPHQPGEDPHHPPTHPDESDVPSKPQHPLPTPKAPSFCIPRTIFDRLPAWILPKIPAGIKPCDTKPPNPIPSPKPQPSPKPIPSPAPQPSPKPQPSPTPQPAPSTGSACLSRKGPLMSLSGLQESAYDRNSLPADTRIDARNTTWRRAGNKPFRVGGGANICVAGGTIEGDYPLSTSWSAMHDTYAVEVRGPDYLLEGMRVHNYGDGAAIWENGNNFTLRRAHFTQIRDDCLSNDHGWTGLVEDSLFDGCYVAFSDRTWNDAAPGAVLTIRNTLVRLQRFEQTYSGKPGHGWFWKWDNNGVKLALHGNVLRADAASIHGSHVFPADKVVSCKKPDGRPDNTIVWLGQGSYPRPEELTSGCFTLTTDPSVWDRAVEAWQARR